MTSKPPSLEGIQPSQITEIEPSVYSIDLWQDDSCGSDEFRLFGNSIAKHLHEHHKKTYLISVDCLDQYLVTTSDHRQPFHSFFHENLKYYITELDPSNYSWQIPDITESEEFMFGLNVWLCFWRRSQPFEIRVVEADMKNIISNLPSLLLLKLKIELLTGFLDDGECFWFNPSSSPFRTGFSQRKLLPMLRFGQQHCNFYFLIYFLVLLHKLGPKFLSEVLLNFNSRTWWKSANLDPPNSKDQPGYLRFWFGW